MRIFLYKYREKSSTKFSPYFLLFERHPKIPYEIENSNSDLFYDSDTYKHLLINKYNEDIEKRNDVRELVLKNISKSQSKQKKDMTFKKKRSIHYFL